MPRPELIAEKPAPEKIEVIQQHFPKSLFPFSDKIVTPEHTRAEEYLDVLPVHEPIELPVGQVAGSDVADKTGVPAQVVGVGNKAGFQQLFANAGSRIGSDALDIGQVDPQPSGGAENLPDIFAAVSGISDDEPAHDADSRCAQPVYRLFRFLPDVPFLKKLEVFLLHGFNSEENHAEVGPRQPWNQFRVADDAGNRRLDQILHAVQAIFDDGFGDIPEAAGVQGNIVVHKQYRFRAASLQLLQVGDYPFDGMAAKTRTVHAGNGAEGAGHGAAARRFQTVHLFVEIGKVVQHAGASVWQPQLLNIQQVAGRVVREDTFPAPGQPRHGIEFPCTFQGFHQGGYRLLPFAPDQKSEGRFSLFGQLCISQAPMVAAHNYFRPRCRRPADRHHFQGAFVLETHAADADQFGAEFCQKSFQPGADIRMNQHQIDNPDIVVREMRGNGAEAQIGHLHYPVKVIGRVRHGQEQDLQCSTLLNPWRVNRRWFPDGSHRGFEL